MTSDLARRRLAERLYRGLLMFQRRRGLRKRLLAKHRLSLLAMRLLGYLDASSTATAADLGRIWNAERSVISRTLSNLERRKLVSSTQAQDGRKRTLSLSALGLDLIKELDAELTGVTNESISGLSASQRGELSSLISHFADNLSKICALDPSIVHRRSEHPINFSLMRISVCGGMYGGKFFGTTFSVNQAQLLDVASQHESGIDISALSLATAMDQSAVSRMAAQLVRAGLLVRRASVKDRRITLITDTSIGAAHFKEHCQAVAKHFNKALRDLTLKELGAFCSLLELAASGASLRHSSVIQERIEVRRLEKDADRSLARGFLVQEAVRQRSHFQLPENLIPKQGLNFGLFINDQLQGVCDCVRKGARWYAQQFMIASETETQALRRKFAQVCAEQVETNYGGKKLVFEKPTN